MKKRISKNKFRFFKNELEEHRDRGIINQSQIDEMMVFYEEISPFNFVSVLVTIGALLIGLGIISFVASNWNYLSKLIKIIIILFFYSGSMFVSYRLNNKYYKTSKAFLYLSALIYGAGLFLTSQIFNFGSQYYNDFLLWSIGAIVMGVIFKDTILYLFSNILFIIYINLNFNDNVILIVSIFIVVAYASNKIFNYTKENTFFNNIIGLNFILYILNYFNVDPLYTTISFFCIGMLMYYVKHNLNHDIFKFQGNIIVGICGVILSFGDIWSTVSFIRNGNPIGVTFGILFIIYLLLLIRKGNIIALIFTCVMILRFYFDTLYDFMPKSLFFFTGGLILLGFGFYFEKMRKTLKVED
ncbi:DUF2157 domain-containing protein [Clostridium sp. DL1XJH146]